ncbi:hypothetical protein CCH79_00007935 [Gambusia affinis]|uniref:Uncharacterized protein n=1 Tax=Gambusia affinis TaxID=33528 RepID=A0A315W165_GAMAF|nr:hypothetical protein CCH79_00007935 [Gambusia affinis]
MKRTVNNGHGFSPSSKPEDPAFLRLNTRAFQYCLLNVQKPISPKWTTAARRDVQNFMNLDSVSAIGLKYVRKTVTSEAALQLNVVDIESRSESLPKHLAQPCDLSHTGSKSPPEVPVDEYHYSTHNIKVGGEEKILAVPLGLFNVPADLSLEINEWFANHAVGNNFTISVAAKGKKGKLLVELFDGSLNVNALVREKVTKMRRSKMTAVISNASDEVSVSKETTLPNEDHSPPELTRSSMLKNNTGPEMQENKEMCPTYASSPKAEQVKDLDIILENNKSGMETKTTNGTELK